MLLKPYPYPNFCSKKNNETLFQQNIIIGDNIQPIQETLTVVQQIPDKVTSQFGVTVNFKQKTSGNTKNLSNLPNFKERIDKEEDSLFELGKEEKTFLNKLELPAMDPICLEKKRNVSNKK